MDSLGNRLIVISGCSGGGKSTLLAELARRGHATVEEPGRRIVTEEQASGGNALPWVDLAAFARRAIEVARCDLVLARPASGLVFFDRGLVDAAAALQHATSEPAIAAVAGERYADPVFLAPPWPDIYGTDPERRHGFEEAAAEYERLVAAYGLLGYKLVHLPKLSVAERADFIMARLHIR